jgi:ubiquinone/menaquinone biosynthesis C-methylase UbiE
LTDPDYEAIKERARGMWALGDYPQIAAILVGAARSLADSCAISAGQEVLDVAAGTGNLALIAAEEGADVVASDFSPAQVELGRARTEAEGVDVEWAVADAEDLPFEDDRFDCAASVFGVMFTPRPKLAARELFRVVKPGGTVGLANWGDFGAQGEAFQVLARYNPPLPEGVPSPREWGDEEIVEQRLGSLASSLQMNRRTVHWEFESWDQMWQTLQSAGPAAAARQAFPPERLAEAERDVRDVYERYNQADDGRMVIDAEYLEIVARKRG